jgi:class 3 adenylate cyclase/tetratricopeptide (TPR) repeat protein
VICSGCGNESKPGRGFCAVCGLRLAASCPACGVASDPADRFCGACGAELGRELGREPGSDRQVRPTATSAARPAPSVAERRLVTVLFVDLVGFTPFAEERDVEEVREALARYVEVAGTVIARHGGTVEKFIGDAVMAIWGAPVAHEDDAERAVRAGLDLVEAVCTLGPASSARAGITTGEAAVTLRATGQGLVAGDLVNTAARLQGAAPAGTVLVGEATRRAASRAIVFEPAGEQHLRGKALPVAAWRAVRVVAELGGRNRRETLETPFVGRTDELRLLKDLLHATGREQRARLVSVLGPAGIGKSRLAWELSKYADGLVEDTWWHVGRCPAHGDGVAFWALGEMVRERAGLLEADDEATTRARVGAAVREWIADDDERRWIEPALLTLLGIETSAAAPEQLFGAWRTFFERIAARGTVVLVFEELHHADPGLLDFIDHLLEWSRSLPLFVLTLARPELLDRRSGWGAGKRSFASISLEPLPVAAMRALLEGLVPGLPRAAASSIVARADGVPLYAVEIVRMLLDDGKLVASDGTYQPTEDLAGLAVPETLTELVAARLDTLSGEERGLVADAAVLGQSFITAALAAVSGIDEGALEPLLAGLVRREIFTLITDPRSPERGQHAFVQALVREVAYSTLSRRDRTARHLAAARHFESLGTDELAGAFAAHYLAAYRNVPPGPEADALASHVRVALRTAAERAASLGSLDQAIDIAEQALAVTDDPAEQAELLELAGQAASAAAHHDRAEELLRRAIALHRARGDRAAVGRVTASLGYALLDAWRTDEALGLLEPAAAELADLVDDPGALALGGQLARARFLTGASRETVEVADIVLEAAERLDLLPILADTLVTKGSAMQELGRPREGIALLKAGLELAEAGGFQVTAFRARVNLGGALYMFDPGAGLRLSRENLAASRRLGRRDATVAYNAAWLATWCGEWDWALGEVHDLLEAGLEREDRAIALSLQVWIASWRGEPVDDELAELEWLTVGLTNPAMASGLHEARAQVALAAGRLADARDEAREASRYAPAAPDVLRLAARAALWCRDGEGSRAALEALESVGAHGLIVDAAGVTIRAGLAALDGRPDEAVRAYRDVLPRWRALGLPLDEAFTAIEMATLLEPVDPEVRAAAERAREILVPLRAQPFLDRLEAAMLGRPQPDPDGRPVTDGRGPS